MAGQLRVWLNSLGLERYADVFAANGIELDVIGDLDGADLAALGVTIGDRKRLARALQEQDDIGIGAQPGGPDRATHTRPARFFAERRWMTVLFCDLVGSTALSDRLDPEELRDVITMYQDAVVGAIVRFRGYVGNFRGDGIIAYFSWPRAHEDQAERAVRAGLAALGAVANLSIQGRGVLRARIGISTGEVVINDIIAEGVPLADVVGRTPNLAARLQVAADPDEILIDQPTRNEIGRHFQVEPLRPVIVKGLSAPVAAWRVIKSEAVETRFEARRLAQGLLVGRTEKVGLLVDCWHKARQGRGQIVLMSGEAGIGKSRLLEALGDAVAADPYIRLRYQCSPLHADTPLYPVIKQYERSLGFQERDSEAARAEKLEANLGPMLRDDPHGVTLIADLLSLSIKSQPPLPDEPPPLQRERLLSSLSKVAFRLSQRRPLLALIEDVQWIDPTTRELLLRVFQQLANRRILAVVTQRVPFDSEWDVGRHVTTLAIERLDEAESEALVKATAGEALSSELARDIIAKADGVPLFIEEITRAVIERQSRIEDQSTRHKDVDAGVPSTLQASLTSRLDYLGSAKTLAQIGAVVGRQVSVALLAAVAGRSVDELSDGIDRLLRSELLFMRQTGSDRTLYFKHALVQEAAYAGLLHAERRRLHGAVLRSLEKLFPSQTDAMAQTLATHAERAEDWERAARYLSAACIKAIGRSANREAISLYHRAQNALSHLPLETVARMAIDLRLYAFSAFQAVGENDKVVEVIGEAERLAEQIGDRRRLAATASESAFALWMAGDHAAALDRGRASLAVAQSLEDFPLTLAAQFHLANVHHARGEISAAVDLHRRIISMLPGELAAKRFGWAGAPGLFSRAFLAWYLVELGEFEEARRGLEEGLEILAAHEQPFSRVLIQLGFGLHHMRRGEFESAVSILSDTLEICRSAEVLTIYPIAAAWLGQALTGAKRNAESLDVLGDAVHRETYRFGGKYCWIHLFLAYAEAHYENDERRPAYKELRRALELAKSCQEVVHYAYGLRLRGDFLLNAPQPVQARGAYEEALAIATPRGVRPLAAHCKLGIAKCARTLGNTEMAGQWADLARRDFEKMGLSYWALRASDGFFASGPASRDEAPVPGRAAS
jgi:class 3 adenylate cyclase/tetratricopeptide (TPR) repeat protein